MSVILGNMKQQMAQPALMRALASQVSANQTYRPMLKGCAVCAVLVNLVNCHRVYTRYPHHMHGTARRSGAVVIPLQILELSTTKDTKDLS